VLVGSGVDSQPLPLVFVREPLDAVDETVPDAVFGRTASTVSVKGVEERSAALW
jgi:hypothetical protein